MENKPKLLYTSHSKPPVPNAKPTTITVTHKQYSGGFIFGMVTLTVLGTLAFIAGLIWVLCKFF